MLCINAHCKNQCVEGSHICAVCTVVGSQRQGTAPAHGIKHMAEARTDVQNLVSRTPDYVFVQDASPSVSVMRREGDVPMFQKYPKYYKAIPEGMTEIDVYGVCKLFPVQDDTGCINHARKKLLVPGTRTGGKSFYADIKEARDTLNRWLELNKE